MRERESEEEKERRGKENGRRCHRRASSGLPRLEGCGSLAARCCLIGPLTERDRGRKATGGWGWWQRGRFGAIGWPTWSPRGGKCVGGVAAAE